jgi:hypothetical protein
VDQGWDLLELLGTDLVRTGTLPRDRASILLRSLAGTRPWA